LLERLLDLAKLEQQQALAAPCPLDLSSLLLRLLAQQTARISLHEIKLEAAINPDLTLVGDLFLLQQAFTNLLDNALDFCPQGGLLRVTAKLEFLAAASCISVSIYNQGEPIPDFALARVTERFFSLARPNTGKKSTGLGLNFVQQVAGLHDANFHLRNTEQGVEALISFPVN
jgi:two-component system, OmpR family, sensor histidine kinase CreC